MEVKDDIRNSQIHFSMNEESQQRIPYRLTEGSQGKGPLSEDFQFLKPPREIPLESEVLDFGVKRDISQEEVD